MITIKKPHLKVISNNKELLNSLQLPIIGSIDETIVVTYAYSNRLPKLKGQFLSSRNTSITGKGFNFVTYKDGNTYFQNWENAMFIIYDGDRLTETVYIKRDTPTKQFLRDKALTHGVSFLLSCRNYVPIHSAAVSKDGYGLLLVGPSKYGKTTLCISLLKKGFSFLSDDVTLLKKESGRWKLFSYFWPSRISYGTLQLYPELRAFVKGPEYTIRLHEVFPTSGKSILYKILLPYFSKCQGLKVKSIGKKDTLCRIFGDKVNFSSTKLFYPDEQKRFDFIFDLVESTECYIVELGKDWGGEVSELLF